LAADSEMQEQSDHADHQTAVTVEEDLLR